ncbi:hypothetical protein CF032_11410 [Klebsiella oxytoca]|nr:hypothetical protein [Klebsiella oxytoca]TYE03143.1 hypothetical protein DJ518_07925 [Klebsiella pneumoniae]
MSESNGPFPCPSPDIELSWRLESNQTLCLARQCSHRCVLVFPSRQRSTSRRHCRRECWHLTVFTVERLPLLSERSRHFVGHLWTVLKW